MMLRKWHFRGHGGLSVRDLGGLVAAGTIILGSVSCGRSDKGGKAEDSTPATVESKVPEKKEPATPPLPAPILQNLGKMGTLVVIPGQPDRQGILIEGARARSSARNYLVVCDVPREIDSVGIACQGVGKLTKAFANRISTLPSGLSLFGFTSGASLNCAEVKEVAAGDTYHVFRLTGEGSVPAEEKAAMTVELESLRTRMDELQKSRSESMRQMSQARHPGQDPRGRGPRTPERDPRASAEALREEMNSYQAKTRELTKRRSEINALLKIPLSSVSPVEVVAGTTVPDGKGNDLDNTLLGTSAGTLRAIRFQGKWIELKEIIAASADQVDGVTIDLSGYTNRLSLTCHLSPTFPSAESSWSLVAVTTFELESQGSGSLEERLARAARNPFNPTNRDLSVSLQPEWNGKPTKLWLKVFNDREPEKPLIDEVVLLDYPGRFSARWGKPPSPLIQLPDAVADTPEDLVKEQVKLDAKGQIRDIIAAGDGSVVMVQTTQAPFWAALDLKSGKWLDAPWKATADTLVATQAGKIYLIDRRTHVLEIRDLASGKREGLQLLQVDGPITAIAAPLTDASQPILVTTEKAGYFLDPVNFEVIPSGLDLGNYLDARADKRYGQSLVNPASICLRASDDGSLYQFSGTSVDPNRNNDSYLTMTVDRSAMVVATSNNRQFLPSRGRNIGRGIPDQGGTGTILKPASSSGHFPGPVGEIRFTDEKEQQTFAVMKNPPVLPDAAEQNNKRSSPFPVADRTAYLDASAGVLLLPDGDALYLVRLNLPEQEKLAPDFIFAGDVFEIPLPNGKDHKLTSDQGGTTEIVSGSIRWTAPVTTDGNRQFNLKMEWTGELGSPISKDYRVQVVQTSICPEVVSPDGLKKIPLRRRTFLNGFSSRITGFAGSGTVALSGDGSSFSAWNLMTGEMLLSEKADSRHLLGDADRIYTMDVEGHLTSYDIQTGTRLGQAQLGKKTIDIATGISSRNSLLAVEQDGVEAYLIQIPRDSLKPIIIDLPQETRRNLFIPQMKANASGSAIWSRLTGIFRDSRAITVQPFTYEELGNLSDGTPDQSGQFVVGSDSIVDIRSKPAKSVKISSLPGVTDGIRCVLDESGRYLLLSGSRDESQKDLISVRDVKEPSREVLKIHSPRMSRSGMPQVVSGSNTLIQQEPINGSNKIAIYEFDIPDLLKQLSR